MGKARLIGSEETAFQMNRIGYLNRRAAAKFLIVALGIGVLCLCVVGCSRSSTVEELGNNYEQVVYTRTSWILPEPASHQFTLQYRRPGGHRTMICPLVSKIVIINDVAVFAARADDKDRLFAVRGLETPLDIKDEMFWRWSKKSGADFSEVLKTTAIFDHTLKSSDNRLYFEFVIYKNGNSSEIPVSLDWNEIIDMMNEVRAKGVVHKTSIYGRRFEYRAKNFGAETHE